MDLIPEGIEPSDPEIGGVDNEAQEDGDEEKAKRLRHSYTVKDKYKVLKLLDDTEKRLRESLGTGNVYLTFSARDLVCRRTGVPMRTLRNWIDRKEGIRKVYDEQKRARKLRRLGSGRRASFPIAEGVVAQIVRERRQKGRMVSKAFILKNLKLEAEKENRSLFLRRSSLPRWFLVS